MSDSVRPHRWQPTRLPHPWDSPGKNTGVGCHFLLQYMKVKSESEVAQSCLTLSDPMDCNLPGSSIHGSFQARVLLGSNSFQFITGELMLLFIIPFSSVQFSRSVVSDSSQTHESQDTRPPCPSPTPGVHTDSRPPSQ